MIKEAEITSYYDQIEASYTKSLEDVRWQLDQWLGNPDLDVSTIFTRSQVSQRVKPKESLIRKALRLNLEAVEQIPDEVEDLLGIRIATPTKHQARELFKVLQGKKDEWFCSSLGTPNYVPYTIEDKNNYSLRSGYQAFHITFVFERSYAPVTDSTSWPVEIQIMSQLWEFWANYSRRYFYAREDAALDDLLPFNVAISRILDSADDVMSATTELLHRSAEGEAASAETEQADATRVSIDELLQWLESNKVELFDPQIKLPRGLFLSKIADDLNVYGVDLVELRSFLTDPAVRETYEHILQASHLRFLPLYQQVLCFLLLGKGWDVDAVVAQVNEELVPQGVRLRVPHAGSG